MEEGAEDRRVRRTKRRLKEALLALIEERDYDAITVADLTERADVARSTFYSHYDSKESLLFDGFDRWILGEVAPPRGHGRPADDDGDAGGLSLAFSLPLLRHVRGQERFFRTTIAGPGGGRIRRRVVALLAERVKRELVGSRGQAGGDAVGAGEAGEAAADPGVAVRAHAVAGAFMGVMTWWLEDGGRVSPEEVDRVFRDVVGG